MTSDINNVKDILLEDYRYRAEAFRQNEQMGERRINLFIAFSGALLTLLGLAVKDVAPEARLIWFSLILSILCILGMMTLFRLIIREDRTDECKRDLDAIRQTFKDYLVGDGLLFGYYPIAVGNSRGFGGLSHLMVAINSLLIAGFVGSIVAFLAAILWSKEPHLALLLATVCAVIALSVAFILQGRLVHGHRNESREELMKTRLTHAGGVVYRNNLNRTEYLIVRPKRDVSSAWVLPKGHIEPGEEHVNAALREVQEEAAVVAQPVCVLDVVRFDVDGSESSGSLESVRAKFYLLEALLCDIHLREGSTETRDLQWLPFEDAFTQLTHAESRHVLRVGEQKRKLRRAPPS